MRHERASFEPRFFTRSALFWPIARAAASFADREDWPDVAAYGDAFTVPPPVRFERAPPKRRRPAGPVVRDELYDARIVKQRVVLTRERMWHDYLNALVWTTFPRAKLALHVRQHRAIERWLPDGATQLPNARTRELDALALLDEGGVLVTPLYTIVFGHALYEGLVFERRAMVSRAWVFACPDGEDPIAAADAALAGALERGSFVSPEELSRWEFSV